MFKKIITYIIPAIVLIFMGGCDEAKKGCTDPNSINYDPSAETSGNCNYPSDTKKVVCFYFNDSDNSTCGSFGINLLDLVKATNPPNTFFITVHPNGTDTLFSPASIDIASAFNVSGFPDFGVGEDNNLLTQTAINNAIANESTESPQAGIDVDYSAVGDSLIITMYGKFFVADPATYFAAAYVVESNIISPQIGLSGSYSHQHVLRASAGTSGMGVQINTLPVTESTSFKIRRGIYIQPYWNLSNIEVIGTIWRQNGTDFEYINAGD